MEGKKVVFFEVEPWEQDFFRDKLGSRAELEFYNERLTHENVAKAASANYLVCFIYSDLSHAMLDQLPQLKGIATMSVGTDHIDKIEAERRRILVSNVPAYGPNTVAEHTVALLLALSRKIVPSVERTRAGVYEYKGLSGWDLQGKTLGVVGTGKIGSLVAKTATALGMKIIAYDPKPNSQLADQLGFTYMPLADLLPNADVITLHVPLTPESKHMLGEKEFALMKRGVVIINSARGGLIDAGALVQALESGQVSEAGLDVLEDEGLLKEERQFFSAYFKLEDYQTAMADHALMRHPRVLVTPHNAFNSKEALKNILQTTVDNITGQMTSDQVNKVE